MDQTIRSALPETYRRLLPTFFDEVAPREEKATCSQCAMCKPEGAPALDGVVYFRPDAKCCTFHPKLPNYLVGAILSDERPDMAEGRRRIRAKIAQRIGVTSMWISAPMKHSVLFAASRASSFGRSLVLRCPYFQEQGGLCTIWRHREAECSTFYCKYSAGADGEAFWKELNAYLRFVEVRLAGYAARSVAPHLIEPTTVRGKLSLEELEDRPPDAATYGSFWQEWAGREEELYVACHERIAALGRADLENILGGEEHARRLGDLERSYREAGAPVLPERLTLSPGARPQVVEGGVLVSTYSRYEPLLLTPALYEVLREFSARETAAEVKARLLRDSEIEVPDAMISALYQMRVLVAADVSAAPSR